MGEKFARATGGLFEKAADSTQIWSARLAENGLTNSADPKQLAAQIHAGISVNGDIRDLIDGVIDPVQSKREGWKKWLEEGAYATAAGAPTMAAAMIPGGQSALIGSFTTDSYRQFEQAGWTGPQAEAAALFSGLFQASVAKISESATKLPGVSKLLSQWGMKPGGSTGIAQYLLRSARSVSIPIFSA